MCVCVCVCVCVCLCVRVCERHRETERERSSLATADKQTTCTNTLSLTRSDTEPRLVKHHQKGLWQGADGRVRGGVHVRVHVLALSSATNCVQPGTGTRPALEGSKKWGQDMERGRMRGWGGEGEGWWWRGRCYRFSARSPWQCRIRRSRFCETPLIRSAPEPRRHRQIGFGL